MLEIFNCLELESLLLLLSDEDRKKKKNRWCKREGTLKNELSSAEL